MDVQMPVMDGLQAVQALRAQPAGQSLLVIATTAAVLQDEIETALRSGMDDVVAKPFDVARIVERVLQGRHPSEPSARQDRTETNRAG